MLLFIINTSYSICVISDFNTSHVTVYQNGSGLALRLISIHLMLLFILFWHCIVFSLPRISIHLMLLFIDDYIWTGNQSAGFQYISCYCLSRRMATISHIHGISIHLMLLFIVGCFKHGRMLCLFQYISCYCLSELNLLRSPWFVNFNTSHVTVYPHSLWL